ncbi:hypothetical protein BJ138DRAFT_1126763 [Hygrophoropsis aurantiaca]|uniref:Uncharacterized protein n=1 Tax=Hygrophoropsis aurantiaca TaxID=72124 RepID=A0ACB8AAQ5_9AGAM|nr:hypothetical protein BJ138DRAFT_1126763 [Hygrophoropsis aurantiaca]
MIMSVSTGPGATLVTFTDVCILFVCVYASYKLHPRHRDFKLRPSPHSDPNLNDKIAPRNAPPCAAYLLVSTTTHARLLPGRSESSPTSTSKSGAPIHAFSYPTLALLVGLRALPHIAVNFDLELDAGWGFRGLRLGCGYLGIDFVWKSLGLGWITNYLDKSGWTYNPIFNLSIPLFRDRGQSNGRAVLGLNPADYLGAAPTLSSSPSHDNDDHTASASSPTILTKLRHTLAARGYDPARVVDAWMLTMPAYFGHAGISPLTVYWVYTTGCNSEGNVFREGKKPRAPEENEGDALPLSLWLVVLEVHNTFGEGHVYVLEVGLERDADAHSHPRGSGYAEDPNPCLPSGYTHQWTFPRAFFVSPFNDLSGWYTVSVRAPSYPPPTSVHAPTQANDEPELPCDSPRPMVRIHLHADPDDPAISGINGNTDSEINTANATKAPGPLKLTALLHTRRAIPLYEVPSPYLAASSPTSSSPHLHRQQPLRAHPSILPALFAQPFALFLALPRVLYQAALLHYRRRLAVYARPEPAVHTPPHPKPPPTLASTSLLAPPPTLIPPPTGNIFRQPASLLQRAARRVVCAFLARRVCGENGTKVRVPVRIVELFDLGLGGDGCVGVQKAGEGRLLEFGFVGGGDADAHLTATTASWSSRLPVCDRADIPTLTLTLTSARFYPLVLLAPSVPLLLEVAKQEGLLVLTMGVGDADEERQDKQHEGDRSEKRTKEETLFLEIFGAHRSRYNSAKNQDSGLHLHPHRLSLLQRIRIYFLGLHEVIRDMELEVPAVHPLDDFALTPKPTALASTSAPLPPSAHALLTYPHPLLAYVYANIPLEYACTLLLTLAFLALHVLEVRFFALVGARFVRGAEPGGVWVRGAMAVRR